MSDFSLLGCLEPPPMTQFFLQISLSWVEISYSFLALFLCYRVYLFIFCIFQLVYRPLLYRYKRGQKLYIFCVLIFLMRRVQYCHTRHYLAISAQLKIWQVSACKWGLRRGIIISQPSTRSSTLNI